MDCISVFLSGIQNVIATSGTAFTEQQVAILKRHTGNVIVNFDPDAAGANAAEKSIALLTEEGFAVKIVSLQGGLDPDRFIREQGVDAYREATAKGEWESETFEEKGGGRWPIYDYRDAIRGARWLSDFLIDRAQQMYPGRSTDQQIKAMNYLLPHIRRVPEKLARDKFAHNAAQKLGIDSAVLREDLRQAALRRRDRVEARPAALTEVERVLLRALAITDPEGEAARRITSEALVKQPEWFEHLGAFPAMQALAVRAANDPMDVVEDAAQRALVAEALLGESRTPEADEVESALQELEERAAESRLRNLRAQIAEAERRGDHAELTVLTQQKLDLDRSLRQLQIRKPLK